MTQHEETVAFQALVLSGIWMLARLLCIRQEARPHIAMEWRGNALNHMDVIGHQTDDAKEHRRRHTYPPVA